MTTLDERRPEPGAHLQGANKQHKLILTRAKNQNDGFRVRCKCMAEYRNVSDRYFNYDTLADRVRDVDEIKRIYRTHLTGSL